MELNGISYLAICFIAILQALLLYLVISWATKAERRAKYEWAQMDLLAKIALKQGVSEDEIAKTFADAGLS